MTKVGRKNVPENRLKLSELDYTPVLVALLVIFITIVLFILWKRKKTTRTDILFTGLCDTGKTSLFTQLLYNEPKETYTSMKENLGDFKRERGPLRVVDLPGYERLRGKFFDAYKNTAKAIVYFVDSLTVQKDVRDVADYLYTILSDKAASSIPVLVLCNKQDATLAKGATVIKALLEQEMNLVRNTRTKQLEAVDNSNSNQVFLGKSDRDFEFSQLSQKVMFVEGSKSDYKELCKWIEAI